MADTKPPATTVAAFTEDDWREMVLRLAHEIRNPLATIKSGVQLVQHVEKPEGETAECLTSVLGQVERIDATVRDMQRFVRIGTGSPERTELGPAVEDAVAQHRDPARAAGVSLVVAGGPRVHGKIDPRNLALAVGELLANAVRFSPAGCEVSVSWQTSRGSVAVHVDDEGPGVGDQLSERIARPFFSTSTQGMGLGLNIVSKICRLAEGELLWRNLPERGCRFSLRLPGD